MATRQQIEESRARLEAAWDDSGACNSCGWHALLYEHQVSDEMLADAIDNTAWKLRLPCLSDEPAGHRGTLIDLSMPKG